MGKRKLKLFIGDPDLPMMFKIFVPIFVDMLLNSLIGSVHAYFVADAGEAVISAISLVNQVNTLICSVFFAACSATMAVVAQNGGTDDLRRCSLIVGNTLAFAVYGTTAIAVLFTLLPEQIMHLFFGNVQPEIMAEAVKYIPLLGWSLPFYVAFYICACASRGYGNHKIPLVISVSGSVANVLFAFVFIKLFHFGVVGAGISRILSQLLAAAAGMFIFKKNKWIAKFKECVVINFNLIRKVLYLGFFGSTESMIISFAATIKTGFLVPFGLAHITASSVFGSVTSPLYVPISVMGTIALTLVAQSIGENDRARARELLFKTMLYAFVMTSVLWIAAYFIVPYIFPMYTDNPETLKLLSLLYIIYMLLTPTITLFAQLVVQGFTGAGDVAFPTIVSIACMLIINLGGGYLLTVTCNLGVIGMALSGFLSLFVKGIIYLVRYKRGTWLK